jgi:hypothetical protein
MRSERKKEREGGRRGRGRGVNREGETEKFY